MSQIYQPYPYLDYKEFLVSSKHPHLLRGLRLYSNDLWKCRLFYFSIFMPMRKHFHCRVDITSGKCSRELNEKLGRDVDSTEHSWEGNKFAVDFVVDLQWEKTQGAFKFIKEKLPQTFGQLILEPTQHILHVSLPTERHCGEAFVL